MWPRELQDVDNDLITAALTVAYCTEKLDEATKKLLELADERKVMTAK